MMESNPNTFPQTPTTRAFVAGVGSATVANGSHGCLLGIGPNDNDAYGVQEFAVYDPIIPKKYFTAWTADTGTSSGLPGLYIFCPPVTSVAMAKEFGVGYVLEAAGRPGPVGSVFVRHLADEDLYRIPGSGQATVAPLAAGEVPADTVVGTPVTVHHPSPSQWRVKTSSNAPLALRLHLTNVPGWKATIDGRPLALESYAGMMLQARIPAGTHTIALRYWPQTFTIGLVLAFVSAACLLGLLVFASVRKRRRSAAGDPGPSAPEAL
jgi:Bacterial membrane protein YfhO